LPVILAGHSVYSEAGFADVVTDAKTYFEKLVTAVLNPAGLQDKTLRAQAFQYAEDIIFGLPTTFLGDFGESQWPSFWHTMSRRIAFYSPVNDPFAIGLSVALEHNLPRTILPKAALRFEQPFEALCQISGSQQDMAPRNLLHHLVAKLKNIRFS
ncbi:MAG: hypothetical protein B7Z22_10700, partial [Hyphomonas sp. 32-62-5]